MDELGNHNTNAEGAATETEGPDGKVLEGITVLQVLPSMAAGGGVERGTVEVARAIVGAGGRALVASAGGILEHDLSRVGAEHVTLPVDSKNPWVMYRNIGRLARVIREENVAIVHARSRAPAWSAWYAAQREGAPFITTFHGTYGAKAMLKRRYNAIMTKGEPVIAISNFIAAHIASVYGVSAARIRVIHRGVDIAKFDPAKVRPDRVIALAQEWRMRDGVPVIMLPGRLTRWKGQTVFIEALARLGERDFLAFMVGSDQGRSEYRRELEQLIKWRDLSGRVRIMDHCHDMPAAYMLTDVVVSASTEPEAFGRVAIEGQAMGRMVIATDHGGASETVIDGQTGWRIPPDNPAALAVALERALGQSDETRDEMAERAMANVRRNFTTDAMCARTIAVYVEAINRLLREAL